MAQRRKARGRPLRRRYPPRVDATADEIAQTMLTAPVKTQWDYLKAGPGGPVYRCKDCQSKVNYPDTLYRDGRCESCHSAVEV